VLLRHFLQEDDDQRALPSAADEESSIAVKDEPATLTGNKDHWRGDAPAVKTEDDEMNDYFAGLFP
jgi:hypothetical protein